MRIIFEHVAEVVEVALFSSFVRRWLLTSSKVGPHCEAVVPTRLIMCKYCQHVFRAKRKAERNLPDHAMPCHAMPCHAMRVCWKTTKRASETSEQT